MGIHARRRAAAAGGAVLVLVLAIVLLAGGGSSGAPDAAVRLVPAEAIAYVHISTDTGRGGVRSALALARRFPAYGKLRDAVIRRLTAPGCGIPAGGVRGKEVAVAVVGGSALVLVDTGSDHKTEQPHACGTVSSQYAGRFLAIGPATLLSQVQLLAKGKAKSLATSPDFVRAQAGLPAGRFADGYVTAAGLRTLLAPQSGLAGFAGVLLDRPGLSSLGFAVEARAPGARLTVHEVLGAKQGAGAFSPKLLGQVPAGSLAVLDVRDLGSAVRRLGGLIAGLGANEQRQIAAAFKGETVLWLTPAALAPRLTLVTSAGDANTSALPRTFSGAPLYSAVVGDKLVASTDVSGIAAVRHGPGKRLVDSPGYRAVLSDAPSTVTSLTFLDFSELLRLAEQTGLSNSRAYQRVRGDLQRVRAVGATSTGTAAETTLQVELSIP